MFMIFSQSYQDAASLTGIDDTTISACFVSPTANQGDPIIGISRQSSFLFLDLSNAGFIVFPLN
ncbi:hypothetical protein, partial [Serratia marcescens]